MFKNILKEISITLLLLIAILLLLGIVFYDYVPFNKTIPPKVEAYTLADDIQQELNKELKEADNIIKTYSVDADTLDQYEYTREYDSGKINPFASVATASEGTTINNSTENKNTNTNTKQTNTQNTNTVQNVSTNSSTGTFFNTVGK